jgi:HK97 gp10 family phage protein
VTRVIVYPTAIAGLADDAGMKAMLQRVGDAVASDAAAGAPKATGEMAASIHAVVDSDSDGTHVNISWDRDHFYGLFAEVGTSHQSARPFLRPAVEKRRTL